MPVAKSAVSGRFIGIDPGLSGSIAVLDLPGNLLEVLPFAGSTNHQIAEWLRDWHSIETQECPFKAALEKVNAWPGQGVCSVFAFGVSYGFLQGLLTALKIPFVDVRPQTWQQRLSIPVRKKDEPKPKFKKRLQAKAHQRWPNHVKKLTLATSDAALIAEYLRLEELGVSRPTNAVANP